MNVLNDILNFLLPTFCVSCGKRLTSNEEGICTNCLLHLPYTGFHLLEHSPLEKHFWGLFPVERATAMFHHDGKQTRHLIHSIKYYHHPEIATMLATFYANQLQGTGFLDGIDAIVPLPLHWRRQLKRHYNQSHYIARGISQVTHIPIYKNVVRRVRNNPSQTHLTLRERIENVEGIFQLTRPELIAGKHILLVDDVTTTGSTLSSCARELAKATDVRISILTLAVAGRTALMSYDEETTDTSVFGIPILN